MWGGFSDLRRTPDRTWAAGEYVIGTGRLSGTNDGAVPSLGLDKTGRKLDVTYVEIVHFSAEKWAESWLFYNGAAVATQLQVTLD
jgi:predicted ester cyclase